MSPDQQLGPVATATTDLVAWLGDAVGAPVRLGPPADTETEEPAVTAWPLELRADQEARGSGQRLPMRLVLRCLVWVVGDVDGADHPLDRILVAAANATERALVLEPLPPQTWLALGVRPRPALLFDVPVQIARPGPTAPLVRQPVRVREAPMRSLHGRVVGPGDIPLAGMRVEIASTGQATHTDSRGMFAFSGVPAGEPARLRLRGRGRHLLAEVEARPADPVVIHCDIEEA
jgi:hypothetical protein